MEPDEQRLADFTTFARAMIASGDLDPAYPVLAHIARDADYESTQWLCYLHLAFYDLASAVTVWLDHPTPTRELPDLVDELPTGIERRGLRGGRVRAHLRAMLDVAERDGGSIDAWLTAGFEGDSLVDWLRLTGRIESIPNNGRWAGYKAGDLWRYVAGLNIEPLGIGAADATGPRDGLTALYDVDYETVRRSDWVDRCEALALDLRSHLHASGVPASIDQVETLLCDFHSLAHGRYYVGHDIDQQLDQVIHHGSIPALNAVLAARLASFPREYLSEHPTIGPAAERVNFSFDDEPAVGRARRRVYVETGEVVTR